MTELVERHCKHQQGDKEHCSPLGGKSGQKLDLYPSHQAKRKKANIFAAKSRALVHKLKGIQL